MPGSGPDADRVAYMKNARPDGQSGPYDPVSGFYTQLNKTYQIGREQYFFMLLDFSVTVVIF